jgi:hypothetical protein
VNTEQRLLNDVYKNRLVRDEDIIKHPYQTFPVCKRVCSELQVNVQPEFQDKYSDLPVLNKIKNLTIANPFFREETERFWQGGGRKGKNGAPVIKKFVAPMTP